MENTVGGKVVVAMDSPEYLICVDCETPCYDFEYKSDEVMDAICSICGNDEPDQFLTESQYEDLIG